MVIPSIDNLEQIVTTLVTHGVAKVPVELCPLLQTLGVAATMDGHDGWMALVVPFAQNTLPVKSSTELLRRTCLRDGRYRLLLDLSIAKIVQNIGRGERWSRLEELLRGPLNCMASRIHQLLRWASERHGVPAHALLDSHWEGMKSELLGESLDAYGAWHHPLWGETRNGVDLFGALVSLYAPLSGTPVHVHVGVENSQTRASSLLIALVQAAGAEQGIILGDSERPLIESLNSRGVPVVKRPHDSGHGLYHLCGRVEAAVHDGAEAAEVGCHAVPGGLSRTAQLSAVIPLSPLTARVCEGTPWSCAVTVCSTTAIPARWPEMLPEGPAGHSALPGRECLLQVGVSEKASLQVAPGLLKVASHPVFGLLLQVLLMEALDRELGDATLILAPPLDRHVDNIHEETACLYRPAQRDQAPATSGFLRLGSLDEVLTRLGREMGLGQICLPFSGQGQLWSYAFAMMTDAGLTLGTTDRWSIHPDLLDRLHSGDLMRQVIRDRKGLRERLHEVLTMMWRNAAEEQRS